MRVIVTISFVEISNMLIVIGLVSILAVYFRFAGFLNENHPGGGRLIYPIALALTISVFAYLYYVGLFLKIDFILVLVCPAIIAVFGILRNHEKKIRFVRALKREEIWKLAVPVAVVLVLTIKFANQVHRWGDWDAWAIWTLHAKFLYYPELWMNMFTEKLSRTHPDYPLMLPSLIAFGWRLFGSITPIVPILLANIVFLALPVTVYLALDKAGRGFWALVALLVLLLDSKFIQIGASQYADTLVAFFILITFILYTEARQQTSMLIVGLLGFIAGSTTWIKNEGLLFFLTFSAVFIMAHLRQPRKVLSYAIGGVVPVLILISFKALLAPQNDLVNSQRGSHVLDLVLDMDRYILIVKHLVQTSFQYYWILPVAFVILIIRREPFFWSVPFLVVALMFVGYFAIYLITPNDLEWHLGASVDRLMHHLYPSCLFLLLLKLSAKPRGFES